MFGVINVILPAQNDVVTLPQTAINYSLYGNSVFIIQGEPGKQTAKQVFVTLGEQKGDVVAIETGLEGGELIATSGQLKLHTGTPVIINNAVQPQ
jgi:membrane fusion protein (multidrug efflux system)